MKTFTAYVKATVGISSRSIATQIRASSAADAKWLLQAIYGFHAVLSAPVEVTEESNVAEMIKAKSPEQQRVANLKATADRASAALKGERIKQKRANAIKTLSNLPSSNLINPTQ
jgi:hypothetical protein